eukprot:NODE_3414_length_1224_cov_56.114441_g3240_i0.p1 GENE.NODE_3414_length_1224_cov_56.114441_g3240_i0~~NODE_3414_length_1224_cov_56.114441_g3240_i0.p1  ORF type:complete len:372 (-),score=22.51 NODE_3414_length_1224_cov_56.114441_g3240_i0:107-1168(-)
MFIPSFILLFCSALHFVRRAQAQTDRCTCRGPPAVHYLEHVVRVGGIGHSFNGFYYGLAYLQRYGLQLFRHVFPRARAVVTHGEQPRHMEYFFGLPLLFEPVALPDCTQRTVIPCAVRMDSHSVKWNSTDAYMRPLLADCRPRMFVLENDCDWPRSLLLGYEPAALGLIRKGWLASLYIRNAYTSNKSKNDEFVMAIHVRRGDYPVLHEHIYFSAALLVLELVEQVLNKSVHVSIFSEAEMITPWPIVLDNPAKMKKGKVKIKHVATKFPLFTHKLPRPHRLSVSFGGNPYATFLDLARADILVASPSSFSRSAGLLSEGVVVGFTVGQNPILGNIDGMTCGVPMHGSRRSPI